MKLMSIVNTEPASSLVRPFFFRLAEWRSNREISQKINHIKAFYRMPIAEQKKISHTLLVQSVMNAAKTVPFYHNRFKGELLDKLERDPRYLSDFPTLTKADVLNAGVALISERFHLSSLKRMKTGGSTGQSAYFFYDAEAIDWSSAVTWFCRRSVETFFRNRQVHFACDFNEDHYNQKFSWRVLGERLATNRTNIFVREFSEEYLDEYIDRLSASKAFLVHAHPSTMTAIAERVLETANKKKMFSVFEPSGEVLYNYQAQKIKNAFGCKIHNRYGLAEAGVIAYQLESESPHLSIMNCIVEFDEVPLHEQVEIGITTLRNQAMPLIRYQTGDRAVFAELNGRKVIREIKGRIHDVVDIAGRKFMTHTIMDILDHRVGGVKEFQLCKLENDNEVSLSIVPEVDFDLEKAQAVLNMTLGVSVKISIIEAKDLVRVGDQAKFRHFVKRQI